MNKEQAIKLAESQFYMTMTDEEIFEFQMTEEKLCMPFDVFQKAAEKTLGRPVFTHEFSSLGHANLWKEYLGNKPKPTMEEIINLIPEDKRIILTINDKEKL